MSNTKGQERASQSYSMDFSIYDEKNTVALPTVPETPEDTTSGEMGHVREVEQQFSPRMEAHPETSCALPIGSGNDGPS